MDAIVTNFPRVDDQSDRPSQKEAEDAVREGDKDTIEAKTNALATASHKLAEQMHQAEQAKGGAQPGAEAGAGSHAADDNVVDAEFEEVKDK